MAVDQRSVYRLRITLRDVDPAVWRVIEVLGDTTLRTLHRILQAAMGWENRHLHVFKVGSVLYGEPDPDFDLDITNQRGVRLSQIAFAGKERFTYEYDFGDRWMHDVVVEAVEAPDVEFTYPRFVDGQSACPPEDVGGPPGYEAFLESFNDPTHEDHRELVRWIGGRFSPHVVDVEAIEVAFARLAAAGSLKKRTRRKGDRH